MGGRGVTRPHDFCEILIGTCWIDDFATQKFCLNNLIITRISMLYPDSGP